MPCTITDTLENINGAGTPIPLIGAQVVAAPDTVPLFVNTGSGFVEIIQPVRTARTDGAGSFTLVLPTISETDPDTTQWRLHLPDGTIWQGIVPNVAGPLTIFDLKNTYSWGLIAGGPLEPPIIAVQGPQGPQGLPGSGAGFRRLIAQPADGNDFTVTMPVTIATPYTVIPALVNNSAAVIVQIPDEFGDRTATTFRCITSAPIDDGGSIDFLVISRTP